VNCMDGTAHTKHKQKFCVLWPASSLLPNTNILKKTYEVIKDASANKGTCKGGTTGNGLQSWKDAACARGWSKAIEGPTF
jgi:hypothetical protein